MKHLWWFTPMALMVLAWVLIRPGIAVIQPLGALPEGTMIMYHSRGWEAPFIISPDSLCLKV